MKNPYSGSSYSPRDPYTGRVSGKWNAPASSLELPPPPQSVEAEMGVVSSIMFAPRDAIAGCVEAGLDTSWFYVPALRTIYGELRDMWDGGEAIDLITFTQRLRDKGLLDSVGGVAAVTEVQLYLDKISNFAPNVANLPFHLGIVRDLYVRRQVIQNAAEAARRTYNPDPNADISDVLDEISSWSASLLSLHGSNDEGISIIELIERDPDSFNADTLIDYRFLCKEGAMLLVGPSEAGKSSAGMHLDICFSCGRKAFGIRPVRPLKILCIQAENDEGDLYEMAKGIRGHLNLSDEERELVAKNLTYFRRDDLNGEKFLRWLKKLVRKRQPDIIHIDPLHAFVGGDVVDPAVTTPFLRNGLNPILTEFHCAAIVNHHTPKTIYRDTSHWKPSDWIYAGAGNADIFNWARAILVIDPTHDRDTFAFRAAKRGRRIGWADEQGHRVFERYFCMTGGDTIFWRDATDEDLQRIEQAKPAKRTTWTPATPENVFALIPQTGDISQPHFFAAASEAKIGERRARKFLEVLIEDERVFPWLTPRPNARPAISYSRQPQPQQKEFE